MRAAFAEMITDSRLDGQHWGLQHYYPGSDLEAWLGAHGVDADANWVISIEVDVIDIPLVRVEYFPKEREWEDLEIIEDDRIVWPTTEIALRAPLPEWWQPDMRGI